MSLRGRRAGVKTGSYQAKSVCFPVSLHVPAGTPCRRENWLISGEVGLFSGQRAVGSGASARSSTTPPSTASPPGSPRPAAAWTRSRASTRPSTRPNAFSAWTTCGTTVANSNWSTRTPAKSSTWFRHRSPSSPTTARASVVRPTNLRSPAMSRCCATSRPASGARRPRRHRAILRHVEVRAPLPLPRPDRRRRRARDGDRPLPRHLQPHPATPSARRSNAAPGLPRHVTQRPTEGPVTATRHRAGLTRHPVIELAGDGSQRRSCAGGGSHVRQLGRRPSAPLDMVDCLAATRSW